MKLSDSDKRRWVVNLILEIAEAYANEFFVEIDGGDVLEIERRKMPFVEGTFGYKIDRMLEAIQKGES